MQTSDKIKKAISATQDYYTANDTPWVIGFSGGKDSSLVVKIILTALSKINSNKEITIIYCDTGVEIPVLRNYISSTLRRIKNEAITLGIKINIKSVKPKIDDRYFVKVIGRGYPSPTNKFRWCTDRLRIKPIQEAIKAEKNNNPVYVALGTRYSESDLRDKILNKYATDSEYIFDQSGYKNTSLFCPIINFTSNDVWQGLVLLDNITSIDTRELADVYKGISGECPIIKMPESNPCSKGRFGCWTCTVISKDKATENLILNGHKKLLPLQEFRSWLISIREDTNFRCTVRRNGSLGLGPFRLEAREKILIKLLQAQNESGFELIDKEEITAIYNLWAKDHESSSYKEDLISII